MAAYYMWRKSGDFGEVSLACRGADMRCFKTTMRNYDEDENLNVKK